MRAAMLDDSLQSIQIEQKYEDVVRHTTGDRYVTTTQLNYSTSWAVVAVCMNTLCRSFLGHPYAAGKHVSG